MKKLVAGVFVLVFAFGIFGCATHEPREDDYRRRTIDAREDARRQR